MSNVVRRNVDFRMKDTNYETMVLRSTVECSLRDGSWAL